AAIGTTAEVKQIFKGRPIVEIRSDRPVEAMRALETLPDVEKTSLFGTAVHAVLRSDRVDVRELTAKLQAQGMTIRSIDEVPPSLEDVSLDVVEKAGGTAA